jgi:hypothetical protein
MTFMTLAQATQQCAPEFEFYTDAEKTMEDAWDALSDAQDAYDSAGGVLDDSTFWDIVGVAVIVGACLAPEPFSKGVCAAGIVGGAATGVASELDRADEIAQAQAALDSARIQYDMAASRASELALKYWDCLFHHLSKG